MCEKFCSVGGISLAESRHQNPSATIYSEHRHLDSHFRDTLDALAGEEAHAACSLLREALEVHFGQEEDLYFPTLWKLRPEILEDALPDPVFVVGSPRSGTSRRASFSRARA